MAVRMRKVPGPYRRLCCVCRLLLFILVENYILGGHTYLSSIWGSTPPPAEETSGKRWPVVKELNDSCEPVDLDFTIYYLIY